MDVFDAIGLLLPALEKVGDKVVGYDDRIRKKFNRALQTALKANDELYIQKVEIHMPELVGLIVLVMDEPSSINTIPLPNYINRDEFRNFFDETKRDEDLSHVLHEERKLYKIKEANDTLKAIDERIKELYNSVEKITNKIESNEGINKGFTHQNTTLDSGNSSPFATEYFARDLLNGDIESFLNRMKSFFANYPYELIHDLEYHYQNVMYLFCNLLGLSTEAEYHTSRGRIDMVVKTQQFIYVFEFKFNKSAKEALEQIDRKEYLAPFRMDGRKLYKVGINFSNKNNNIAEWLWEVEQSSCEAVNHLNGNNQKDSIADSVSPLVNCLNKKLKQKRDNHPSFKLMNIEDDLFPDGMITFEFETEALDSDNKPKRVKDIVEESWNKPDRNHLMIEGIGGIGKTVTLLSLPDKFAPHYVPAVYIPLHELQGETSTIEKYIKGQVLDYNDREIRYGELMDVVGKPWDKGPRLLLLLDGFNEIANERRVDISRDIEHWSERPGVQIITSSRYDIRQYVALGSNYSKIELQALTPEKVTEYLHRIDYDVPANRAVMDLIRTPLLLTLYIKTEKARICRQSPLAEFRETKNAGSLIWNYLQSELWRYRGYQEETKACVLAMEFIAPYIAWNMQQHNDFVLKEGVFLDWTEDAYKLLEAHFGNSAELPKHIKNTVRLTSRQLPEFEIIRDLLKEQLSLFNKQERIDENNARIVEYRLMHQQFRDALAAMHLINLSYLSGNSLPQEWNTPIDHYVMQFIADLIIKDEANHLDEANQLWEQNRKTIPANDDATRNQLRLQGLLHNNDFSHLDFSGLDLSDISLYPLRFTNATIKLPSQSKRMKKTKLSDKTFSPEGHQGRVTAVAVTLDGKRIVSGSDDCNIRVWDLESGSSLGGALKGHKNRVTVIAVTPDGKHIVSGSDDLTIRVWNLETGAEIGRTIEGHENCVTAVAVTPDGKRIVSGSEDCTIRVWNLETGEAIGSPIEGHENYVTAVAVAPDGKHIVSGSRDRTIRVWDLETGVAVGKPIEWHKSGVNAVAVTPDGKRIVSGYGDNTIRVWDLETGEAIGTPIKGHKSGVATVAVTLDGKRIVSGAVDGTVRVWDLETGMAIGSLIKGHKSGVTAVAVTPDGKRIVSGSADHTIRVWDIETGTAIGKPIEGHIGVVNAVALTLDGKRIVSACDDCTIRMWDIDTGAAIVNPIEGHIGKVADITVTPDGKRIVSRSWDCTIHVWDIETGAAIGKPIEGHNNRVRSLTVTPDGKRIVSGSWDCTIRVWDLETGAAIGNPIEGHKYSVNAVAVTPDGKRIVSGSGDGTIRVWDLETGAAIGEPIEGHEGVVTSVVVTPDGKRIVSRYGNNAIRVWDMETGAAIRKLIVLPEFGVTAVTLTQDGKHIVSRSDDRTIRVWDMETGEAIGKPIKGHEGVVTDLAVTPDGKRIVSRLMDGTICITDLEPRCITDIETREVKKIKIHPLSFVGLDFSLADIPDAELKETLRQNGAKV